MVLSTTYTQVMRCYRLCNGWAISNRTAALLHCQLHTHSLLFSCSPLGGRIFRSVVFEHLNTSHKVNARLIIRTQPFQGRAVLLELKKMVALGARWYNVGTCKSFFCVQIESQIESAVRFSNRIFESNRPYIPRIYRWYLFCICHEREWCTQLSTCYSFQFSHKTRQTMPLYDYLTPKLDFKCKFNHCQSFLYKGRLTVRAIRKFRIGSSLRIESRIGSSIRNRIESRSFAGPY